MLARRSRILTRNQQYPPLHPLSLRAPLVLIAHRGRSAENVPSARVIGAFVEALELAVLGFGANLPAISLDGDGRATIRQAARALASCSHTRNRRTALTYSRGFSFIVRWEQPEKIRSFDPLMAR
jgi:hypothetical protein